MQDKTGCITMRVNHLLFTKHAICRCRGGYQPPAPPRSWSISPTISLKTTNAAQRGPPSLFVFMKLTLPVFLQQVQNALVAYRLYGLPYVFVAAIFAYVNYL